MADCHDSGCRFCGKPTKVFVSSGKHAKYCSAECNYASRDERKAKAEKRSRRLRSSKPKRGPKTVFIAGYCSICSTPMVASLSRWNLRGGSRRVCGTDCAKKLAAQKRRSLASCEHCGTSFIPKESNRTRFCSRECDVADRKEKADNSDGGRSVWCVYFKNCASCGRAFSSRWHGTRYCRAACKEKGTRHRTSSAARARYYGVAHEHVRRIDVFERDGWRCQACGCETPRSLMGLIKDNAPQLDHIVPISRGGPHTMDNVQCLCRLCNQIKGTQRFVDFVEWMNGRADASTVALEQSVSL